MRVWIVRGSAIVVFVGLLLWPIAMFWGDIAFNRATFVQEWIKIGVASALLSVVLDVARRIERSRSKRADLLVATKACVARIRSAESRIRDQVSRGRLATRDDLLDLLAEVTETAAETGRIVSVDDSSIRGNEPTKANQAVRSASQHLREAFGCHAAADEPGMARACEDSCRELAKAAKYLNAGGP